jgi:hypothetical protein
MPVFRYVIVDACQQHGEFLLFVPLMLLFISYDWISSHLYHFWKVNAIVLHPFWINSPFYFFIQKPQSSLEAFKARPSDENDQSNIKRRRIAYVDEALCFLRASCEGIAEVSILIRSPWQFADRYHRILSRWASARALRKNAIDGNRFSEELREFSELDFKYCAMLVASQTRQCLSNMRRRFKCYHRALEIWDAINI